MQQSQKHQPLQALLRALKAPKLFGFRPLNRPPTTQTSSQSAEQQPIVYLAPPRPTLASPTNSAIRQLPRRVYIAIIPNVFNSRIRMRPPRTSTITIPINNRRVRIRIHRDITYHNSLDIMHLRIIKPPDKVYTIRIRVQILLNIIRRQRLRPTCILTRPPTLGSYRIPSRTIRKRHQKNRQPHNRLVQKRVNTLLRRYLSVGIRRNIRHLSFKTKRQQHFSRQPAPPRAPSYLHPDLLGLDRNPTGTCTSLYRTKSSIAIQPISQRNINSPHEPPTAPTYPHQYHPYSQ